MREERLEISSKPPWTANPALVVRDGTGGRVVVSYGGPLRRSLQVAPSRMHAEGRLAFAWDLQQEDLLRAAVAAGVDAVYSDHVDRMQRVLGGAP